VRLTHDMEEALSKPRLTLERLTGQEERLTTPLPGTGVGVSPPKWCATVVSSSVFKVWCQIFGTEASFAEDTPSHTLIHEASQEQRIWVA
jgi:hypothetical protein